MKKVLASISLTSILLVVAIMFLSARVCADDAGNIGDAGKLWNYTITVDDPTIDVAAGKPTRPSTCSLWLPDGVKRVRALFLFTTYGCWNNFATDPQIRDLARDLQCGIVLSEFYPLVDKNAKDATQMLTILQTLATRSGHPEVANAPLFIFSHSNSTPGMAKFASLVPTRIAGWVAMKSAQGEQFEQPELYRIPGMVISGEEDTSYFQNQLETVRKLRREHGALMHMLVEAGGGHWPKGELTGPTYQIVMAFLKNVFYLRVPADGDATLAPIKLNEVVEADGWLGQNVVGKRIPDGGPGKWKWEQPTDVKRLLEIAPYADYPCDARDASWLPTADYARKWQEYCHTVAVKDWASLPPGTVEAWNANRHLPAIDGLESTLLATQVKRLAAGSDTKAVVDELRRLSAANDNPDKSAEATRILGVLDQLGGERLAQAKRLEATHPPCALAAYVAVVHHFDGFAVAEAAREHVIAKDLQREVMAWAALDRLIQLDSMLVAVAGTQPRADDVRFATANKEILNELDSSGNDLLREFANTVAAKEARAMLTRLAIPVPIEKADNVAL